MEPFISFLFAVVIAAVVLLIVDRLGMGLSVGGFVNAAVAAIAIAVVASLTGWLLGALGITI